ncbi:20832_t:CDS:2, partial [Gigaspora rosea]
MKLLIFVTLLTIFSSGLASAAIVAGQYFDRIVTVIFENQDYSKTIEDTYLKSLYKSSQGLLLTSYDAAKNYVAMIYGSTDGATDDGDFNLPGQNLVDLLEAKSITWKAYMENYTCGVCFTGANCPANTDLYARKHNPFISMENINTDPTRQQNGDDISLGTSMRWFQ